MILGFTWLRKHNPEIDWQTKEVRMSRCPPQCSTCRAKAKVERQAERIAMVQIHACRPGSFPVLIKEIIDEDSYPPEGVSEPDRGVAFGDDHFDDGFDDEIEDSNRIFVGHIHGENAEHFVRAASTVSQRLVEAFTKNSKATSFRDVIFSSLYEFEDVFSEGAFDHLRANPRPGSERFIQCLPKNRENWTCFWKKPWRRDAFGTRNRQ
jgi:hypothetical protein